MTEERVRSLIAKALTDKEEHIRRVVKQELVKPSTVFRPGDTFSTDGVAQTKPVSKLSDFKDAGPWVGEFEYLLWNTPSGDAGVAQRQSACSSPAATSPLREFVDAADAVRWSYGGPRSFDDRERYDTARSRVDVEEIEKRVDDYRESWNNLKRVSSEQIDRLRSELDELRTQRDALRIVSDGQQKTCSELHEKLLLERKERDRLHSDLERANRALDSVADTIAQPSYGIDELAEIIKRTGRLGGDK
jgi:uncharacterized protein YukE